MLKLMLERSKEVMNTISNLISTHVHEDLFDISYLVLKTVKIQISWLLMKPADLDLSVSGEAH